MISTIFRKLLKGVLMTKEQKAKLKSIKKAMEHILEETEVHLVNEPKVITLNEYQIIYGVAHVLFENKIVQEINETGKMPESLALVLPKQQTPEEQFENTNGESAVVKPKTKTYH